MPTKTLTPERVSWEIDTSLDIENNSAQDLDPGRVVVPYNVAQYQLDDYRLRNGWPVQVPKYDVRQEVFASASGEILSSRPNPASVVTAADVRWIPTELTWDPIAFRLSPEDGPYKAFTWHSATEFAPTYLADYSYRVGKEIISRTALNFVSANKEHLWSDFVGGFAGLSGYTAIMVLSLESKFGTDGVDLDFSGLLCAGHATPAGLDTFTETVTGATTDVQLRGRYLWARGGEMGFQQLFPINLALTRAEPSYLAITVDPPYTKVYMGFGVATMQIAQVRTGLAEANHLDWVLGRATGDVLHCADMTLFDMSLYANPLSDNDLLSEIATLSQAYGG